MARTKRMVKVGEFKYAPANLVIEIRYDNTEQVFWSLFAGQTLQAPTQGELESALKALIKAAYDVEWKRMIIAKPRRESNREAAGVRLAIERVQWAYLPGAGLKLTQWDAEGDYRIAWSHFFYIKDMQYDHERLPHWSPPYIEPKRYVHDDDERYYIPYTDQIWDGLIIVQQRIAEIGQRLSTILGTSEGLLLLDSLASALALPESAVEPAAVPE